VSYWTDIYEKLFDREVPTQEDQRAYSALYERVDVENFFQRLTYYHDPIAHKHLGQNRKNLELIYKNDSEIMAAVDKRLGALLTSEIKIETESEELRAYFEENVLSHKDQLIEDFWWAVAYGYNVEQIIYNKDRSGAIDGFSREQYWRFTPYPDLKSISLTSKSGFGSKQKVNELLPYGKWVLTVHKGTSFNPFGEALFSRLYMPYVFRCNGFDFWMNFLERFASGFMIGKNATGSEESIKAMRKALDKAAKAASIVVPTEDDVSAVFPPNQGAAYKEFDDKILQIYLRAILGETQTSVMENRGSSASAEVHDGIRAEKTLFDIKIVEKSFRELVKQVSLVNGFDLERNPLKIRLIPSQGLEAERAERDSKLKQSGVVSFTKDYLQRHYGFEEDEIEVPEPDPLASLGLGQGKSIHLSSEDQKNLFDVGKTHEACGGFKFNEAEVAFNNVDEVVNLLERLDVSPLDFEQVIATIFASKDRKDLEKNLDALFYEDNPEFSEIMTQALYSIFAEGYKRGEKV
jgi:phage gp29-like protein